MVTLVYAPKITVRIYSTKKQKTIDVSDDLSDWNVHRIVNGVSTADFTLLNAAAKYNGVFSPMDRVVIYMRRLRTVLVFSGYLDSVPMWSSLIRSARFRASDTLKLLQNFLWDPGSPAAYALFLKDSGADNKGLIDGGLTKRTIDLMTLVAGWTQDRIHIGSIPNNWFDQLAPLVQEAVSDAEAATLALKVGSSSYLGGSSPMVNQYSQITGIGPGTGTLPNTTGKISAFGGPHGGAYGNMALTGESGTHPADVWYCAMRWPYVTADLKPIAGVKVAKAMAWWRGQRILVTSPKTHKAVILRAADWGPNISTGRVLDVSPTALSKLGIGTDDTVNIAFADQGTKDAPLGVVDMSQATSLQVGTGGATADPAGGFGKAGDTANMRSIKVQGITFTVNAVMVDNFTGFVNELVTVLGYTPQVIGGFVNRNIAGSDNISNHAYGAAIDIDPAKNPRYSTGAGGKYALPGPPAIINLARRWGLGWGGEYQKSKDYMHFEALNGPASNVAAYHNKVTASSARTSTGLSQGTARSSGTSSAQTGKWQVPVAEPWTITEHFGAVGGLWANGHTGTDFDTDDGVEIHPVGPGVVHAKGTGDASYGNHVTIDHGKKVYTYYAHMKYDSPMSVGVDVATDTIIGYVGQTGNATGSHLHLELRLDADTYDAAKASGGIEKYVPGGAPPPRGVPGVGDAASVDSGASDPTDYYGANQAGGGALDLSQIGGGLFNVATWYKTQLDPYSLLLTGNRALMNDQPILDTIAKYINTGFRQYCSAPNGDFIAWFPDYFGHYHTAGKMVINPIEIQLGLDGGGPPSIEWSDEGLKTHHFAIGSQSGVDDETNTSYRMINTAGIASVEDARLIKALFNVSQQEAEAIAVTTTARYGPRIDVQHVPQIPPGEAEFFYACMEFMKNWSAQWRTTIEVCFMPEIWPGMLACFPTYAMQGYVQEVSHSGSYGGGGFNTSISCAPWSSMGSGGPGGMVKGAAL